MRIYFRDEPGRTLTLHVWDTVGGAVLNPGGTLCSESETSPGWYSADVAAEFPAGLYEARIYDASGVIGSGWLDLPAAADSVVVNAPATRSQTAAEIGHLVAADLAATKRIVVAVPALAGNELSPALVAGASYLADDARALTFSAPFAEIPEGAAVTLTAIGAGPDGTPRSLSLDGDVVTGSGPLKTVRFSISSAESAGWVPGRYEWQITVELSEGNTAPFLGPGVFLTVLRPAEASS